MYCDKIFINIEVVKKTLENSRVSATSIFNQRVVKTERNQVSFQNYNSIIY